MLPRFARPLALSIGIAACAGGALSGCGLFGPTPVNPDQYAGCWRFQIRSHTSDGVRNFIDRDFVLDIDETGTLTRVLMRKAGEPIDNATNPTATFVELMSPTAAANLQNSFFPDRVGADPSKPDVTYNSTLSATTAGFTASASIILTATTTVRYALNVDVSVSGSAVTNVTGTLIDSAGQEGTLVIQQLLTGAQKVNAKGDCPANVVPACDRFYDTTETVLTSPRLMAFDSAFGLAGQAIISGNNDLQFIDLATGERRATINLLSPIQGRMAVDERRRRLYATSRNSVGNNTLAVIDIDGAAILRMVELKPDGCIDTGIRGAAAVIPSTGNVLVTTTSTQFPLGSNVTISPFDGVVLVDPVAGLILGALQNIHCAGGGFFAPADLAVFENQNMALVANVAANVVTMVPLTAITGAIRGGDMASPSACVNDTTFTSVLTSATDGTRVLGLSADSAGGRGIVITRGATDSSIDARFQTFTLSGAGATATLSFAHSTNIGQPVIAYGVSVDPVRGDAYIARMDGAARHVSLTSGALLADIPNIATAEITGIQAVVGRNRVLQTGFNPVVGEYCLP